LFSCKGEAFGRQIIILSKGYFPVRAKHSGDKLSFYQKPIFRMLRPYFAPTSPVQKSGVNEKTNHEGTEEMEERRF
ncbi:MAG: hypothetical protein ACKPA7_14640, partial [Sphaerospermopsis kisseleviana]